MASKDTNELEALTETEAFATFSRSSVAMVLTNPRLEDNPIVYANDAFMRVTGFARHAVLGRNCRFLQGKETDPDDVRKLREGIAEEREVSTDILNYRADGKPFINRLLVAPVLDEAGDLIYFLGIQKELSEDEGRKSSSSGERAMREIQHRVKNHLAMIVGLIRVQARSSETGDDYTNLARRVESLQMLYEEMTGSTSKSERVNLGAYLTRVANAIVHIDGRPGIRVNINTDEIIVPVDPATRIGLVVSEILTNAFQHAFEGRRNGLVELSVTATAEGGLTVRVMDDGIGIPDDVTWPDIQSLGGRIVMGLIEGLGGDLDVSGSKDGTVVTMDVAAATLEE